jgi:hypothetical protein
VPSNAKLPPGSNRDPCQNALRDSVLHLLPIGDTLTQDNTFVMSIGEEHQQFNGIAEIRLSFCSDIS